MKLLELKDVVKDYKGFKALDKVSFSIEEGSIYGFVGENGAGKTTTMNIICGLSKGTSGKILFMGKDIKENRNIGYLPQEPKFYEFLTVREYMDFIISSCGIKDKDYGDKLLKKDNQSIYYEVSYKGEIKISSMPGYIKEIEHRENKILIKLKEKLSYENELYKYILSSNATTFKIDS